MAALLLLLLGACAPPPATLADPAPHASPTPRADASTAHASVATVGPEATAEAIEPSPSLLAIVKDDVPAARAQALAESKLLLVDVWAPWCHTCLSMKHYVLPDPALRPLWRRVVLASVDSDRPANRAFVDRYAVSMWPTFFVLDPKDNKVLGLWQGSASVEELRRFVTASADARDAARDPNSALAAMVQAKQAQARGDYLAAASAYQVALRRGGVNWLRRSEALSGWLFSEYKQQHWARCAQLGVKHLSQLEGAAVPTDAAYVVLACAGKVKAPGLVKRAREQVVARLKRQVDEPPLSASMDDRSDALALYSKALVRVGDQEGARQATERQLALLERAAANAANPAMASTFDYARMGAYLKLGMGSRAVAMLRRRMKQLPDAYEPPARLAEAFIGLKRHEEALAPLERALKLAYGPRRFRYLSMRAGIFRAEKDEKRERDALGELLAAFEKAPKKVREHPRWRKMEGEARGRLAAIQSK